MRFTPAVLICVVLVGCGGGGDSDEPTASTPKATATATAAATKAADAEGQVRDAFASYNAALLDRDFDKACSHLAPETTDKLRENVKTLKLPNTPDDCAGLLDVLYEQIDKVPDQKKLVEGILKSAKLDNVTVEGEKATLDWHATVNGKEQAISQTARLVDGEWKLVDVTN
jgi:hypothetical protein